MLWCDVPYGILPVYCRLRAWALAYIFANEGASPKLKRRINSLRLKIITMFLQDSACDWKLRQL